MSVLKTERQRPVGAPTQAALSDEPLDHTATLEAEIEAELERVRTRWGYRIEAGRARFERDVRVAHRRFKQSIPQFIRESSIPNLLTAPVIVSLMVPIALLDLWVTLYQAICFRVYGITPVRRSHYIVIDRHHLAYLNAVEKFNCVFCAYSNGVLAYLREVAGRTEQYWCPIRHATRTPAPSLQYRHFVDYGDGEGYRRRLMFLRNDLQGKPGADNH